LTQQAIFEKLTVNHGLSNKCLESFTLSNECRTSDEPEIILWGDSYAMHLVPALIASKPDVNIIQMTKVLCGPIFDMAPIAEPHYPLEWARGCLDFNDNVRAWLKQNSTVKFAVISSPFHQYTARGREILLKNGEVIAADTKFAMQGLSKTLDELEAMGITPVIVTPPPTNGINLGRCLVRAMWVGESLDACSFSVDEINRSRVNTYQFLDTLKEGHHVIGLEDFICKESVCRPYENSILLYRDRGHLSREGSAHLGKKHDFYKLITSGEDKSVPVGIGQKDIQH
jgi:hypothetical protein